MKKNNRDKKLFWILSFLYIFNVIDALFTHWAITTQNGKEMNPFMDYLIQISPLGFVVFKIVIMALLVLCLWRIKAFWSSFAVFMLYFLNFLFQMFQLTIVL